MTEMCVRAWDDRSECSNEGVNNWEYGHTTMKVRRVTLTGKGTCSSMTCCVLNEQQNIFSQHTSYWRGRGKCVSFEGDRLGLFCIWVHKVYMQKGISLSKSSNYGFITAQMTWLLYSVVSFKN